MLFYPNYLILKFPSILTENLSGEVTMFIVPSYGG